MTTPRKLLLLWLCALPQAAHADTWIAAEAPAAFAVSNPQGDVFQPGVMPALGFYLGINDVVAFGLRGRAGILADGSAMPGDGFADPGRGGLGTGGLALRVGARAWLELVAGGGVTGDDAVAAGEIGVGYRFDAGRFEVGPSVRLLGVAGPATETSLGDAGIVLVGVEVKLGGEKRRRPAPPPVIAVAPDADAIVDQLATCEAGDATCAVPDRDGDGIADADDRCPDEPEVVNGVDDQDGCPDAGPFVVIDDRIVLEETVLFDFKRARIKRSGQAVIAAIAAAIAEHPEWQHVSIEGHADVRGTDEFNRWLSDTRASRVSEALAAAGAGAGRLSWVGHGATRPRDPGTTEHAHARNRRVEFVITRHREVAP